MPLQNTLNGSPPQYKGSDAVITINQLMNHSSGIPVYSISLIPEGDESKVTLEETIRKISHIKLDNEPGKVYNYATINYDVLALIIEKVTGQKYEDYITDTILREVGMTESFFRTKDSDSERVIPGRKAGFFYNWKQKAPTYYGNTAAGYPAKIGLCISSLELEDFLFVICTLLILYISLLLKYKHKWVCLCAGIAILAGVIFFLLISHFSYRFLFVWMPFSFTVMISALIAFALRLILAVIFSPPAIHHTSLAADYT